MRFTHTIDATWELDNTEAGVTCLYVGRFEAVVADKGDHAEWELYMRDTRLTFGTADDVTAAREKAQAELLSYFE